MPISDDLWLLLTRPCRKLRQSVALSAAEQRSSLRLVTDRCHLTLRRTHFDDADVHSFGAAEYR